ncbi:MAG TPA: 2-dehydropantoate 2-reductase [Sedimentisphaerales bacterium]|nr:2-dehydropantoate 2-reductase [Sedimentisphaerales bacterium]
MMKVLIYGGGAVGLGIASCLLKSGAAVDIIARENTIKCLREKGLRRNGIFGDYYARSTGFGSYAGLDEIQNKKYDYVLVCTKSFDSFQAAKDLSGHTLLLNEDAKIVLFQNGWGNAEIFSRFFRAEQIYNARVITGFTRSSPNEVTITVHADSVHIGSMYNKDIGSMESLCALITNGDLPCRTTKYIAKDLWAKMLYNCALNALGAILDVPYGVLGECDSTKTIMNEVVQEIFAVMTKAGYGTHRESAEDFLKEFYGKLIPDTFEHKSSTLQSILAKKKTEIDALNGAVIALADKHNVKVPYNSLLYNIIKFIEDRYCKGN